MKELVSPLMCIYCKLYCITFIIYMSFYRQIWFSLPLEKHIIFTKCWRISVRGYTKARLYSTVSNDIRNCTDINQVRPSVVIDATGIPILSGGIHTIFLFQADILRVQANDEFKILITI